MASRRLSFGIRGDRSQSRRLRLESLEERVVLSATATSAVEPPQLEHVALIVAPPGTSLENYIHTLQYTQFNLLDPSQIPLLLPEQVASIPDRATLFGVSEPNRAAFTQPQIQALQVGATGIDALTAQQRLWLTTAQLQSLTITTNVLNLLTPTQISLLNSEQVRQFEYWNFPRLSVAQVPYLSASQLQSLPNDSAFRLMTAAQRAALTAPQVQSLDVLKVSLTSLTTTQRGWLSTAQIQKLPPVTNVIKLLSATQISQFTTAQVQQFEYWNFPRLNVGQIPYLTTTQLQTITNNAAFTLMSASQRAALTVDQVQSLEIHKLSLTSLTSSQRGWLNVTQLQTLTPVTNVLNLLTPTQIAQFTASQVRQFEYWNFSKLGVAQVPNLTSAQLGSLPNDGAFRLMSASQRAALTTAQVQSLDMLKISLFSLTSTQRSWLSTAQLQELPPITNVLNLLTASQIGQFTTAQVQQVEYWNLWRLNVSQIPLLTVAQLRSIPNDSVFQLMSAAQRAALSVGQVQSLDVLRISLNSLTTTQRSWLTAAQLQRLPVHSNVLNLLTTAQIGQMTTGQVQQFDHWNFPRLLPTQIPLLTPSQIASIPSASTLSQLSDDQLNRLTIQQIQSLNVANVGLAVLTPAQRTLISIPQIQALKSVDFAYLTTAQLRVLTTDQFAATTAFNDLFALNEEQRYVLSSEQVLSLPLDLLIRFTAVETNATQLLNFTPARDFGVGPDGLSANPHAAHAWSQVLDLVPTSLTTHAAVASGEWTNPQIWAGGQVPTAGARVYIPADVSVRLSAKLAQPITTVRIDGALDFNPNVNTQLVVDTIVVNTHGALRVGTAVAPIQQGRTARIILPSTTDINTLWDPHLLSRGIISRGEVRMFGTETTSFATLAVAPSAGDTTLQLSEVPVNWKVGDRLKLAGTRFWQSDFGAEEVIIRAISGTRVTIDALQYGHAPPAGYDLDMYVANMTRNVEIIGSDLDAEPLRRPHLMFMHSPDVQLVYAGVYGLGRTNKMEPVNPSVVVNGVLQPGTGGNPLARYAIHFHHTGVDPGSTPSVVRGTVVDGSAGWAFVNHQSYSIMEDNVSFGAVGAAFVGEDGNEIGVFRNNLALSTTGTSEEARTRIDIHDFGHSGHGFWMQGPTIGLEGNVSAGSTDAGFVIFAASSRAAYSPADIGAESWSGQARIIPVSAVPLTKFADNVSFTGKRGLDLWYLTRNLFDRRDNVVENFTTWGNRASGIELEYTTNVTIDGGTLLGSGQPNAAGVSMNHGVENVIYDSVTIHDYEVGAYAAPSGATLFLDGSFRALQGIAVTTLLNPGRSVSIVGDPEFLAPTAPWAVGRPVYSVYLDGAPKPLYQSPDEITAKDHIVMNTASTGHVQLYYYQQAANYVPFPSSLGYGYLPSGWLNKTNTQLQVEFGLSFAGETTPFSSFQLPGVYGAAVRQ